MEHAFQPGIQKEFLAILILEFDDVMVKALSCLLRNALDCEQSLIFLCKVTAREKQVRDRRSR